MDPEFEIVGIRPMPQTGVRESKKRGRRGPAIAAATLALIVLGCLACDLIMTKDPAYLNLYGYSLPPCREFLFGTDTMGRDIFSMIWYGGRTEWLDLLLMRMTDILLSIPWLLAVILVQAVLGEANVLSLSFVLGLTSWMSIARVVRSEVRRIRHSEYVIASRCMGGSFFHVLWKHLTPNFLSSIMFMVVMNVRNAIVAESTLSFMGVGLPVEEITWGSMLSLSEKAFLTNAWWIILIPGFFLLVTLFCITSLGNCLRETMSRGENILR